MSYDIKDTEKQRFTLGKLREEADSEPITPDPLVMKKIYSANTISESEDGKEKGLVIPF